MPQPLAQHLVRYLRIADPFATVPGSILGLVQDLEAGMRELPKGYTQVDVHALLQSWCERFSESPIGMEVFGAIVDIFYANDFLSKERAQELCAGSGSCCRGRTTRELLTTDE